MSIIIKIDPVRTITRNGSNACVIGIDMTSGDSFHGRLEYEPGKERNARWRSNGDMRDAHPHWNLQMARPEIRALYEVAKRLGARLN